MALGTHIKSGGTIREAKEVHAKTGGIWRDVQEIWTKVSGTWEQVYKAIEAPVSVTVANVIDGVSGTVPLSASATATPVISPVDVGDYNYAWTKVNHVSGLINPLLQLNGTINPTLILGSGSRSPISQGTDSGKETWNCRVYNDAGTVTSANFTILISITNEN
jgi:hypothetical protein